MTSLVAAAVLMLVAAPDTVSIVGLLLAGVGSALLLRGAWSIYRSR